MTHHLSTCMLAPYVTMHLKEKKVWGSHKIRVIFLHSMWQGIQKLMCSENNSVFWSTGVFWKHFSSLMHCHTWCKQASNLHEDKEWITQPFSCTDWKKMWGEWMVTSRWVDQKHFYVRLTTTHWKLANILQQYWNVKLSIGYKC